MPTVKGTNRKTKDAEEKAARVKRRPIVYPEIVAVVGMKTEVITVEKAKELLGWEEEALGADGRATQGGFGNNFALKTPDGKKVRLNNNVTNRPIYWSNVDSLKQEILRGRWKFNGEALIIGRTGLVLNGQHTLLALVFAEFEFKEHPERWPAWKKSPTMDKLIVYGVDEGDEVVNTMDTCKPRSLADVIYRASYFKSMKPKDQKAIARYTENAIKFLWQRTGVHENAFAVKRTHSESVAYLEAHPKLLDALKHVFVEDGGEGKLKRFLGVGASAALLYLMACSDSDAQKYYLDDVPSEKLLDMGQYEKACDFFVKLVAGDESMKAISDAIGKLVNEGAGSVQERWAILAKAWNAYKDGKPIDGKALKLEFSVKDGVRELVESPLVGGIDVGEEGIPFSDPTPEEIQAGTEAAQAKKWGKPKKAVRKGEEWAEGDSAWVHDYFEQPELVRLTGAPYKSQESGGMRVMVDAADGPCEVDVNKLSLAQFELKS